MCCWWTENENERYHLKNGKVDSCSVWFDYLLLTYYGMRQCFLSS